MQLEMITRSEASRSQKDKHHMTSLICGILKKDTNELIYKAEIDRDTENKLMVTKVERGRDKLGGSAYTYYCIKNR